MPLCKPRVPAVQVRPGAPIFWAALCGPGRTCGADAGDVADLARLTPTGARSASNCAWTAGQGGPALSFGSGGSVDFGVGTLDARLTTRMTVCATVTFNATGVSQNAVSKISAASPYGWRLGTDGAGNLHYYCGTTGTTGAPTGSAPTPARRYRLQGVFDGGQAYLYDAATLVTSAVATGSVNPSGAKLMLGTSDGFGGSLNGLLEDVQIFNYALTLSQLARDAADPWWRLRPPVARVFLPGKSIAAATFSPASIACPSVLGSGVY